MLLDYNLVDQNSAQRQLNMDDQGRSSYSSASTLFRESSKNPSKKESQARCKLSALASVFLMGMACFSSVAFSNTSHSTDIQTLRAKYKAAQLLLDKKQYDSFNAIRPELEAYPLTPYLDYRVFNAQLGTKTPAQVNAFTEKYQDLPFTTSLRANYLDALAKNNQWSNLLEYQTEALRTEKYRCNYYYAQWAAGDKQQAYDGAKDLFLSGKSVADECDKLFAQWAKAGHRTDDIVLERMLLSYPHKNSRMTTIMSKWLVSPEAKAQGQAVIDLIQDPSGVLAFSKQSKITEFNQELTAMAYYQWVRKDVASAVNHYDAVMKGQKIPQDKQNELSDYAAFRLVYTSSSSLAKWRDNAIKKSRGGTMVERRIRLAIERNNWKEIAEWIDVLPDDLKESTRWQYWSARVAYKNGDKALGDSTMQGILGQRDFYSVAAAEWLNVPVEYPSEVLENPVDISANQKALSRIAEMMTEEKIISAKREWMYLLGNSSLEEQQALALYASEHKWPHMAILATIKAKMWGHLSLRFPVTYVDQFEEASKKHDVSMITMMALSRQESAMDVNANSPVGARGLMQIMPKTAQYTAKKYGIKYSGVKELNDAQKNIEIGGAYLGEQMSDYDDNRIFSFAAYNAGPSRVTRWRGRSKGRLDAYMFIEIIPFTETRNYVQNILMFETYYRNLLDVEGSFLTNKEAKAKY